MAELVDALDSKSGSRKRVRVQVPSRPPCCARCYCLGIFLAQRTLSRYIWLWLLVAWYNWVDMKKKIVLGVILVVLVVAACLSVGVMLNWRNNTNSAMQDDVASRNDAEDFASGGGVVAEDNTTGENAGSANIEVKDLAEIAKEDGKVNIYFFCKINVSGNVFVVIVFFFGNKVDDFVDLCVVSRNRRFNRS